MPLGESLRDLPHFMALANTTFVNLRSALDQLTPLVNVSKPAAPKLQKLLVQLRPLAVDSVPTVRDLAQIISSPGANNDLIDLTRLGVPLADATVRNIKANGKVRPGAFPESITSLKDSTPELATDRPYAVDLTGWFEGFTHPGGQDANGSLQPGRPDRRHRLGLQRGAQRPQRAGRQPAHHRHRAQHPGLRDQRQQRPRHHRTGRSLPGLDGARRGLVPGDRLPV